MSQTAPTQQVREGDRESVFLLERGRRVDVVYEYRDIEWDEPGLRGTISNVLVGVDEETNEIVLYPPAATPTIRAWREKVIQTRQLDEKRAEQARIDDQMRAFEAQLAEYEKLGLLDEYGCLDEEKYERYMTRLNASAPTYEQVFGELRSALQSVSIEPSEIFRRLDELYGLDADRAREKAELYMFKQLTKRTGRSMYEEKRLKAIYDWAVGVCDKYYESSPGVIDVLGRLASGSIFQSSGAPTNLSIGRDKYLKIPTGLFRWTPSSTTNSQWFLCASHCDAVWSGINDWKAGQEDF